MTKVNIEAELLANHTDEEIIEYMATVIRGVVQNYRVAIEKNEPELLFASFGDIITIMNILTLLKKRADKIKAAEHDII